MTFGKVLGELREKAGLTQAALAGKANLSLRTIQAWEQDRRSPVSPDFFKLVKALGASCDAFADCEEVAGGRGKAAKGKKGKSSRKGR